MYKKSRARYFFLLPGVIWILAFTLFPPDLLTLLELYQRQHAESQPGLQFHRP